VNIPYIILKFRKQVLNYYSVYEETRKYFVTKGIDHEKRNPEEIVHMPHQEISIQMQVKKDILFSISIYYH